MKWDDMVPINVVELFAGVGGFRFGLENCSNEFQTIWANQWEPGKKVQYAFDCYVSHFGESPNHVNEDIAIAKKDVPNHDLLVGGFPCQDYSVAHTGAIGIEGKKGVLWWEINSIITNHLPSYVILENVDRLLKSPAKQRGRDFAVILRCLNDLGYAVEWRVINAAEYGYAQRRRRTFIVAYRDTTPFFNRLSEHTYIHAGTSLHDWLIDDGFFAPEFPVQNIEPLNKATDVWIDQLKYDDLAVLSSEFESCFYNSGVMINGHVYSEETTPTIFKPITLDKIRLREPVDECFFLNGSLEKWEFLKGSKKIARTKPNGDKYFYSEGGMCFPDRLDLPSRTMLTSESSINRSTHVIEDYITGRLRLLTPVECERLNGFNDNWTNTGMPQKFRYFVMGNALVVPIITRLGNRLLQII